MKHPYSQPRCIFNLLLIAFALALFAWGNAYAEETYSDLNDKPEPDIGDSLAYVPGQIVLKFIGNAEIDGEVVRLLDTATIGKLQSGPVYLLQFDPNTNVADISQRLQLKDGVAYTHPNYILDTLHPVQGSRAFGDEEGNGDFRSQYAADVLELTTAHTIATGEGVKIGVIDGGLDVNHHLFQNSFGQGYDYIDDDDVAFDEPGGAVSGHGTFVAGLIHLVAPAAEIVPYRIMDSEGRGNGFTMARAIEQAVYDGCKIINISSVMMAQHRAVSDAIDLAESNGAIVIAAAGNRHTYAPCYPAADQNAIAVTAVDSQFTVADFSNYGQHIDICAPGVDMYSAYQDDGCAWWSGTSFAAPCVTGQVALLAEIKPDLDVDGLLQVMSQSNTITMGPALQENLEYYSDLGEGSLRTVDALTYVIVEELTENTTPETPETALVLPEKYYVTPPTICCALGSQIFFRPWSSTPPTTYTVEILPGGDGFLTFGTTQTGIMDKDLVEFGVKWARLDELGIFTDTVRFTFAGFDEPVDVVVVLDKTEDCVELEDVAEVVPLDGLHFVFEQDLGPSSGSAARYSDSARFAIFSTNAPAQYTLLWDPQVNEDQLWVPYVGETPDTTTVWLRKRGLPPGVYWDTSYVDVHGVANDWIRIIYCIEILPVNEEEISTNYPNPFNPSTTISFRLKDAVDVELTVYNILGQEVVNLVDKRLPAGDHEVLWNGTNSSGRQVGSGMYLYRLKTGTRIESKKMLLLK